MQHRLEEIKRRGNYSVILVYGEDVGCDDIDIPQSDRNIIVYATPVGFLGGLRTMWKGPLKLFMDWNFDYAPTPVSNPPKLEEYINPGYYVWGTGDNVKEYLSKF